MAPLEADCQTPPQRRVTRWASKWPEQLDVNAQDGTPDWDQHFAPVGTRGISMDGFYSERKVQSCPIANLWASRWPEQLDSDAQDGKPELHEHFAPVGTRDMSLDGFFSERKVQSYPIASLADAEKDDMPNAKEPSDSTWSEQLRINMVEQQCSAQEAEEHFAPLGTRAISLDGFYSERKVQSCPVASVFRAADEWFDGEEEEENAMTQTNEAACCEEDWHAAASEHPGKVQSPQALPTQEKKASEGFRTSLPLYHISQVAPETPRETWSRSCSVDSAKPASSTSAGSRGTRSATTPRRSGETGTFLTAEQFKMLQISQENLLRQNAELLARIEQLEVAAKKSATSVEERKGVAKYFDISDDAEWHESSNANISNEMVFSTDSDRAFNTSQEQSMLSPDMTALSDPSSSSSSRLPPSTVSGRTHEMPEHDSSTAAHQPALTTRIPPPPPTAAPVLSASVLSEVLAPPAPTPSSVIEIPPLMTAQGPHPFPVPEIHTPGFGLPAQMNPPMHVPGVPGCVPPSPAPTHTFPPAQTLACFEPAVPRPASALASHSAPTAMMPSGPPAVAVLPPRVPAPPCLSLAAQLPDPRLEVGSAQCQSVGSADHFRGKCRPCAFFHNRGCESGKNCKFCHLCPAGEKKRRQRDLCEAGKARTHLWRMAVAEAYAAEAARQAAACREDYPQAFRR